MNTNDIELPTADEAAAHIYPSDLERFKTGEHVGQAFSITVGNTEGEVSEPLFTLDQVRAAVEADRKRQADWHRIADDRAAEIVRLTALLNDKRRGEPVNVRPETDSEHIARDIREGRFPEKSDRKMVPAEPVSTHQVHRGAESLPCYCNGTRDHTIGDETTEQVNSPSDEDIIALALANGMRQSSEHWGDRYYTELGSDLVGFARALLARYTTPADFDTWRQSPYTQALEKSIAEDYVPKHDTAPTMSEPTAPEGWQLVPIRPTDNMLIAAQRAWLVDPLRQTSTLWSAMLAAAPQPEENSK